MTPVPQQREFFDYPYCRRQSGLTAARTAERKAASQPSKKLQSPRKSLRKTFKKPTNTAKAHKKTAVAHAKTRCNGNIFYFVLLFFASGLFVAPSSFLLFPELRTRFSRPVFLFCASFYTQFFAYFLSIFYAAARFALFVIRFRDSSRTARESSGSAR